MRTRTLCLVALFAVSLFAAAAHASHEYEAVVNLSGANERPTPNASTATGTAFITINTETNQLTYSITYAGLTGGTVSAGHIHGFADQTTAAGVLHGFGSLTSPINGVWNYTQAQEANILAGLTYVNIHSTPTYPGGEIRGQIYPLAEGAAVPSMSQWGLVGLGLTLALAGGVLVVRRRRLA
jgi:hypothetical protein